MVPGLGFKELSISLYSDGIPLYSYTKRFFFAPTREEYQTNTLDLQCVPYSNADT